jgi:hypothetical protein
VIVLQSPTPFSLDRVEAALTFRPCPCFVHAEEWHSTLFALEWMPKELLRVLYWADDQLGRIFKPFGAFLATKVVILIPPAKAVISKV